MVGVTSDYIYTWEPNVSTNNEANEIAAGTYQVTISDLTGDCAIVDTINVSDEGATDIVLVAKTPATCLAADGTGELSPDYLDFNWGGGRTGAVQTDLAAGTYTVTATNAAGCESVIFVEIETISPLAATVVVDNEPTCYND